MEKSREKDQKRKEAPVIEMSLDNDKERKKYFHVETSRDNEQREAYKATACSSKTVPYLSLSEFLHFIQLPACYLLHLCLTKLLFPWTS